MKRHLRLGAGWVLSLALAMSTGIGCLPKPAWAVSERDRLLEELKMPVLPPVQRQALDALVARGGFATGTAAATWEALSQGQTVVFTLKGGPTGENIPFPLTGLQALPQLLQQVEAQERRDRYRPDFGEARRLLLERLPQALQQLGAEQISLDTQLQERLRQDQTWTAHLQDVDRELTAFAAQHQENAQAQMLGRARYDQLYAGWQQVYRIWQEQERVRLQIDARRQQLVDEVNPLQRQLNQELEWAQREENLIRTDPANAELHRQRLAYHYQRIQQFRQRLQYLHGQLNTVMQQLGQQNAHMQHIQRDLDYWKQRLAPEEAALRVLTTQQTQIEAEQTRLNALRRESESKQRENQTARQQLLALQPRLASAHAGLAQCRQLAENLPDYGGYAAVRTELLQAFAGGYRLALDADYQSRFAGQLEQRLQPLLTLFKNMDRPPLP
ncbi:MAG: hypothetical protein ACO1RX_18665 [Candidatus Sericytochromatia bacterium]